MGLTVMVVDSGARGHAISLAYEKSADKIIVAPGNDFIAYKRKKEVIADKKCSLHNPVTILDLAKKYKPDLIDVAQDDVLAAGTVDLLQRNGFLAFGPTQAAARIEWDKIWSKEFMQRHGIPTASFAAFEDHDAARKYVTDFYLIQKQKKMLYVKAAGLCGGKGAVRAGDWNEAMFAIEELSALDDTGKKLVIEEGLVGEEFSSYAISDGTYCNFFPSAQDHKRLLNFDHGPQTGGMGAVSPIRFTLPFAADIEHIIEKTISGMNKEGHPYRGILYLGGIVTDGKILVLEFNARWGDPESHVVLPAFEKEYFNLIQASLQGNVGTLRHYCDAKCRVCVVGAARGYPKSSARGKQIFGLEQAMQCGG